jgi:hypothetical protein
VQFELFRPFGRAGQQAVGDSAPVLDRNVSPRDFGAARCRTTSGLRDDKISGNGALGMQWLHQ